MAARIEHLKKPDMAREAEQLIADVAWLPDPLRTPAAPDQPKFRAAHEPVDPPAFREDQDAFGRIDGRPGHDFEALLLKARADLGCVDDDGLAADVRAMIARVQSFDPFADRFRYPAERNGKP